MIWSPICWTKDFEVQFLDEGFWSAIRVLIYEKNLTMGFTGGLAWVSSQIGGFIVP
jgi:hypothetical protein